MIEDIPVTATEVRHTAVFDLEDPTKISGSDIEQLDGFDRIETNIFRAPGWGSGEISHLKWTLLVNGVAFPLTGDDSPPQVPGLSQYGSIFVPVAERYQRISQLYDHLK